MKRGLTIGAIALAVVAGVAVGAGADPSPSLSGLPRAMGLPDCAPGEGYSSHEMDYVYGAGYPTPREALDAALNVAGRRFDADDFSSRDVRAGGQAVREFTLERPDGAIWVLAVAFPSDGGWLVSSVYECFLP